MRKTVSFKSPFFGTSKRGNIDEPKQWRIVRHCSASSVWGFFSVPCFGTRQQTPLRNQHQTRTHNLFAPTTPSMVPVEYIHRTHECTRGGHWQGHLRRQGGLMHVSHNALKPASRMTTGMYQNPNVRDMHGVQARQSAPNKSACLSALVAGARARACVRARARPRVPACSETPEPHSKRSRFASLQPALVCHGTPNSRSRWSRSSALQAAIEWHDTPDSRSRWSHAAALKQERNAMPHRIRAPDDRMWRLCKQEWSATPHRIRAPDDRVWRLCRQAWRAMTHRIRAQDDRTSRLCKQEMERDDISEFRFHMIR